MMFTYTNNGGGKVPLFLLFHAQLQSYPHQGQHDWARDWGATGAQPCKPERKRRRRQSRIKVVREFALHRQQFVQTFCC